MMLDGAKLKHTHPPPTRTGTPKNSAWLFLINSFDNPEAKVGEN
jgi:hypothetical protein